MQKIIQVGDVVRCNDERLTFYNQIGVITATKNQQVEITFPNHPISKTHLAYWSVEVVCR